MASRKYSEPGMGLRRRTVRRDGRAGRARDLLNAWVSRHAGTHGPSARCGLIGAASVSRIAGTRIDRNGASLPGGCTHGWCLGRFSVGTRLKRRVRGAGSRRIAATRTMTARVGQRLARSGHGYETC
ncbi:hypothetical protein MAFF211471_53850 (plasmid) [Ralstonia solanacearum]|nr:hypothetical protein MAFF211471_53850 [Ralstonia solanacearum]BCN02861.1 hypothetical protein RPSA_53970 [Ralstonia solanacearum]BEU54945.1 hypothetical protein MAFF211520_52370 [Ralstonia pseudosolanacearum]BEU60198.1 hypothetical protein MAFF211521_52510 [Ralstonia pseudosolanacearum]BEU65443.1 hypothetical protein MAFF301524_52430 [Ralstonia pseudosolanacearum]